VLTPRVAADDYFKTWSLASPFIAEEHLHLIPKSGTLGPGLQYRYDLSAKFKLRLEYAALDYTEANTRRYINYDLNLQIVSRPLILDWHPFGGAFRTSAGVIFGHTTLSATVFYDRTMTVSEASVTGSEIKVFADTINPAQTFTVNQYTVKGSDIVQYVASIDPNQNYAQQSATVSGRDLGRAYAVARYPSYAPYLGIGWGNLRSNKDRLLYSIDIGAMYLGRPQVQMSLSGPVSDLANQADAAATQAYLAQEQGRIEEALSKYRYYPVLSVGLWYRF
jgi:hypothetical protein